ncbi:MAG: ABC transporter permease subunit [Anaerocolumna sp.]
MNVFIFELKALLKSSIGWCISMLCLSFVYFSIYSSLADDMIHFKNLLEGYPESVRALLGVSLDTITSVLGYYSMILTFVVLCGAIQGMIYGTSILSKEYREKTSDFLLVKPMKRTSIVTSKILAGLTMLVVTWLLYYIGVSFHINVVKTTDYSNKLFFMMNLTLLLLQITFFAIGLIVSILLPRLKSVLPISLGIVFGLYIMGAVLAQDKDDILRFISPFRFVNYTDLLYSSQYEVQYVIAAFIIIVLSIITTYSIYAKRDIHAA